AVLGNSSNPLNRINLETAHRTAKKLSVAIEGFEVRSSEEVRSALRALVEARPDAALLASDTLLLGERRQIVDTMATNKIPAIYPFREYAEAGGFVAYGASISILFRRSADYVDRILKGERPSNLPVQQATAFEIIVNQRAAAGLGLSLPASLLVRADEVIEEGQVFAAIAQCRLGHYTDISRRSAICPLSGQSGHDETAGSEFIGR